MDPKIFVTALTLLGVAGSLWAIFSRQPLAPAIRDRFGRTWATLRRRFRRSRSVKPLEVKSDGLIWRRASKYNYLYGLRVKAYCPKHDLLLREREVDGSGTRPLGQVVVGAGRSHGDGIPWCGDHGGHELPFTESANYEEARHLAEARLDRLAAPRHARRGRAAQRRARRTAPPRRPRATAATRGSNGSTRSRSARAPAGGSHRCRCSSGR